MRYLQSFKIFESFGNLTSQEIETIKMNLINEFPEKKDFISKCNSEAELNKFLQFQMQENPQNFGVMDYKDIDEESAKYFLMKYLK